MNTDPEPSEWWSWLVKMALKMAMYIAMPFIALAGFICVIDLLTINKVDERAVRLLLGAIALQAFAGTSAACIVRSRISSSSFSRTVLQLGGFAFVWAVFFISLALVFERVLTISHLLQRHVRDFDDSITAVAVISLICFLLPFVTPKRG